MNIGALRNKLDVYEKTQVENELGEIDTEYAKTKSIFGNIVPDKFSGKNGTETVIEYAETTHRIFCRKKSLIPTVDMYFIYDGLRYDILYFQPDFKNGDYWEIMAKVKYE